MHQTTPKQQGEMSLLDQYEESRRAKPFRSCLKSLPISSTITLIVCVCVWISCVCVCVFYIHMLAPPSYAIYTILGTFPYTTQLVVFDRSDPLQCKCKFLTPHLSNALMGDMLFFSKILAIANIQCMLHEPMALSWLTYMSTRFVYFWLYICDTTTNLHGWTLMASSII